MGKNRAAVILGRLARGKKKILSKEEIQRRTERLARAREKRWHGLAGEGLSRKGGANPTKAGHVTTKQKDK